MHGKFIVFEGLDGSGQSTQAKLLKEFFERQGKSVVMTKEPTAESDAGREIIEVIAKRKTAEPKTLQELFVEDRRAHLKNLILPALEKGDIVISDRYAMSTMAFGAIACDQEWLIEINKEFLWPDITFVLQVRPEVSMDRIHKRGKPEEFFETAEKLAKVSVNYKNLIPRFPNCFGIDGERSIEEVHKRVRAVVQKVL